MRWYDRLYVGEKAKKHRYEIIQAIRQENEWASCLNVCDNPK